MLYALYNVLQPRRDSGDVFDEYLWQKRVMITFAPDKKNAEYLKHIEILKNNEAGIIERDLVHWVIIDNTMVHGEGKLMPHMGTGRFYRHFNVKPHEFTFILLGKDGGEKLRKANVVDITELYTLIDSMPMRQTEMAQ
ncbi:MAG: DUF4174 domain-containing protein [Alphaproteobacteria bacterium]|nr:DUF4174 domain-containing protein [Alphaproteobacteria bacterium]